MGRLNNASRALNALSLGISIVVAIAIGVLLGVGAYKLTGAKVCIYLGAALGVAAAIMNVYKAAKHLQKELKELEENSRYKDYSKEAGVIGEAHSTTTSSSPISSVSVERKLDSTATDASSVERKLDSTNLDAKSQKH